MQGQIINEDEIRPPVRVKKSRCNASRKSKKGRDIKAGGLSAVKMPVEKEDGFGRSG
jgi:hypothetical protein